MGARTREEVYLDKAINRYSPDVATTVRAGLKKLRARFPVLDDPYIRGLMTQALRLAAADLRAGRGQVVPKSKIAR